MICRVQLTTAHSLGSSLEASVDKNIIKMGAVNLNMLIGWLILNVIFYILKTKNGSFSEILYSSGHGK